MPRDIDSSAKANGCHPAVNAALDLSDLMVRRLTPYGDVPRTAELTRDEALAYGAALRLLTGYFNHADPTQQYRPPEPQTPPPATGAGEPEKVKTP